MGYFLTGVTGFIGSEFLKNLLRREGTIYALVRQQSVSKINDLKHQLRIPDGKLVAVPGDLSLPGLGLDEKSLDTIRGKTAERLYARQCQGVQRRRRSG